MNLKEEMSLIQATLNNAGLHLSYTKHETASSDCYEAARRMTAVMEEFEKAKDLLRAVVTYSQHAEDCDFAGFRKSHRRMPQHHPIWEQAPPCDCWVARVEEFLKP